MNSTDEMLSVQQVSGLCGVNRNTVGYWCRSGKIHALKTGNRYAIPKRDLRAYLESTGRGIPGLFLDGSPQAWPFRTIRPCWRHYREKPNGHKCDDCLVFQNHIKTCFIGRELGALKCPEDCHECGYFHDTYLPRMQVVHQVGAPGFIYKDFRFWGGNRQAAVLSGFEERQILGLGVEKIVHRDSLEIFLSEAKMLEMIKPAFSELRSIYLRSNDKGGIEVNASFYPLCEPEGAWLFLVHPVQQERRSRADFNRMEHLRFHVDLEQDRVKAPLAKAMQSASHS